MQKILVIDDEEEAITMLTDFLSSRGYEVSSAYDGEEGMKKLDKENPDLVICDIKMPKKDGFQFLKDLRSSRKWLPVIIISGLTDTVNILKGYDFEADYYVTKPINLEDLLKSVKIMLSLAPLRKK